MRAPLWLLSVVAAASLMFTAYTYAQPQPDDPTPPVAATLIGPAAPTPSR